MARRYITGGLYTSCTKTKTLPSQSDLETALKKILKPVGKSLIVMDALDELREDVREELVTTLASLKKSLFLTSREIELDSLDTPKFYIKPPDIEFQSIVEQELTRLPKIKSLIQREPGELDKIISHIQSKSNGMYAIL